MARSFSGIGAGVPAPEPPPFSLVTEKTPDPGAKPGRDRFPGPPRLFCGCTAPGAGEEAIVGGEEGGMGEAMLCCPFSGFGSERWESVELAVARARGGSSGLHVRKPLDDHPHRAGRAGQPPAAGRRRRVGRPGPVLQRVTWQVEADVHPRTFRRRTRGGRRTARQPWRGRPDHADRRRPAGHHAPVRLRAVGRGTRCALRSRGPEQRPVAQARPGRVPGHRPRPGHLRVPVLVRRQGRTRPGGPHLETT